MSDECLILFLKYPRQGKVKTRLAKDLGDKFTLRLYECFLGDMLDKPVFLDCETVLFLTPPGKIAAMKKWLQKDFPLFPQQGKNLGERMLNAFKTMFARGYERCVLIGSDFPDLPVSILENAFTALKTGAEAVIGPAADGGYYLLGFRRRSLVEAAFSGIQWGADRVFQETVAIFERQERQLKIEVLPRWWDIDDIIGLRDFFLRSRGSESKDSLTMRFLRENAKFPDA